jgi:hypothetical protein
MMYVRVTRALAAATLLTLLSYAQAQPLPPEGELHVLLRRHKRRPLIRCR